MAKTTESIWIEFVASYLGLTASERASVKLAIQGGKLLAFLDSLDSQFSGLVSPSAGIPQTNDGVDSVSGPGIETQKRKDLLPDTWQTALSSLLEDKQVFNSTKEIANFFTPLLQYSYVRDIENRVGRSKMIAKIIRQIEELSAVERDYVIETATGELKRRQGSSAYGLIFDVLTKK